MPSLGCENTVGACIMRGGGGDGKEREKMGLDGFYMINPMK